MAEDVTIARPYAEAVNRLAQAGNSYDRWSQMLAFAAAVAENPDMAALIDDPRRTDADLADAFLAVCAGHLDAEGENLVRLLIDNDRLLLLPQVRDAFEALKAAQQGVIEAEIRSAFPLDAAAEADLVARLARRLGRKVEAAVVVDPALIGGVKIVAGDVVIDASVQGQLQHMAFALKR